jgi:hypothetical protein
MLQMTSCIAGIQQEAGVQHLNDSKRNGFVQHGGEAVHKGYTHDGCIKEVRSQVEDSPHGQPSS